MAFHLSAATWKHALVRRGKAAHHKQIALTFDDGPTQRVTPRVLEILRREGVPATFFVVGARAAESPELLRAIVAGGHEIGNHSQTHTPMKVLRRKDIRAEITLCESTVWRIANERTRLFRAPYGLWSRRIVREAMALGYQPIHWSTSSRDWRGISAHAVVRNSLGPVGPGTILLFHDGFGRRAQGNRDAMIESLPMIIQALRHQGYEFVTVSKMIIDSRVGLA